MKLKIGHGYDVHRLTEGRKMIIGGVEIPYTLGLLGHSDADVLCHAVADALLGAAGKRDIGYYFPDTDERYHGISSLLLLAEVKKLLNADGYVVGNIDCTLIAQKPKMAPHLSAMRENIASVLQMEIDDFNIKATTEEKLGFTGRGEGISAHAVCLLQKA
ncbi:MAG: 2-C-methyl-D-erythritol 2,4-cyclodiphosphate synthase [Clostridia bacterium]|nr:2-C-methyl-D-erythritol 2,4-cyclodiphosphate synthase [Clostridia bacterium]MBP3554019.1 2-C-methyl-D-erythritol 2,4-cyclodiphosphate synthase [Clostridia bacterium]MBQ8420118.1 2-C-methyl-D-erythritol 2,4-cyclodiphosphate synthase [Clostridia bacterium]